MFWVLLHRVELGNHKFTKAAHINCKYCTLVQDACCVLISVGSPNCPNVQTIFNRVDSLAVLVYQSHKTWLTVCYHVEVIYFN